MSGPFPSPPELFDETGDAMAFGYGIKDGFLHNDPRPKKYKSAEANPFYYYPGFAIAWTVKAILLILAAKEGVQLV